MAKDFRELVVWEQAMVLAERIYALTDTFPASERYGLTAQMRRAAVSVPSCIAEGNARSSTRDYLRFLAMAAGSLAELQTQTALAYRLGLVEFSRTEATTRQIARVSKLLQKLRGSLRLVALPMPAKPSSRFPVPGSRL